jgi:hypothetical protein
MLNPYSTPFTQAMGVFIKYLVGVLADKEFQAVFGQ